MSVSRLNEYFIDRDGISREVIQADICRYLGNDALVRVGEHQGRQGYFIRAYRNLTTEMIADLKADSARWEAETARRHREGAPREPYVSAYDAPTRSPGAIYGSTRYSDPVYPPTTVPYVAPAASAAYPYTQPPGYIPAPVYDAAQPPYAPVARPPPVSGADVSAGFAAYNGAAPYDYGARPPRFPPVSPYDGEPDYPVSTGIGYAPPVAAVAPDVYPHVPRNVRRH